MLIPTILFKKSTESKKNRRTCAEFVAYILLESKIHKFDKKLQTIHPMDFLNDFNQKVVYKGKMRDINWEDFL